MTHRLGLGFDIEFAIQEAKNMLPASFVADVIAEPIDEVKYETDFGDVRILVQDDAGLYEISTDGPVTSVDAEMSAQQVQHKLRQVTEHAEKIREIAERDLNVIFGNSEKKYVMTGNTPFVRFSDKHMKSGNATPLGCSPDTNVFFTADRDPFDKPNAGVAGAVRTLGAHLHISSTSLFSTNVWRTLAALWALQELGSTYTITGSDAGAIRRVLYGAPGAVRMRMYGDLRGMEFRSSSTPVFMSQSLSPTQVRARTAFAKALRLCLRGDQAVVGSILSDHLILSRIRSALETYANVSKSITSLEDYARSSYVQSLADKARIASADTELLSVFNQICYAVEELKDA